MERTERSRTAKQRKVHRRGGALRGRHSRLLAALMISAAFFSLSSRSLMDFCIVPGRRRGRSASRRLRFAETADKLVS